MTHYFERNIVEIKVEYTECLCNVLVPLIYEGIKAIYKSAVTISEKLDTGSKVNPNIKNPGILKVFQGCLKDIPTLNKHTIEVETKRIKEASKCSEWFDDLVKAVVKSYIILLTFNASGKKCKLVNDKYHEKVDTIEFIHKCYIECARIFFNSPELFWQGYDNPTQQQNMNKAMDHIKIAVCEAIKKMLPIKLILQEYLMNDYIEEPILEQSKSKHIGLTKISHGGSPEKVNKFNILESSSESSHKSSHKKSYHGKEILEDSRHSHSSHHSDHSTHSGHSHKLSDHPQQNNPMIPPIIQPTIPIQTLQPIIQPTAQTITKQIAPIVTQANTQIQSVAPKDDKYISSPFPIRKSVVKSFEEEIFNDKHSNTQERDNFFEKYINDH